MEIVEKILSIIDNEYRNAVGVILNYLIKDRRIVGLFWCGSSSRGKKNDIFNDLDLIAIASQDSLILRNDFEKKVVNIEKIMHTLKMPPLPQFGDLLSIYFFPKMLFSVDIGFIQKSNLNKIRLEPYGKIIKDIENIIQQNLEFPPDHPLKRSYSDDIWLNLWKVRKALLRQDLWNSHEYLSKARKALLGQIRLKYQKEFYPDRPHHGVSEVIPQEILEQFNLTWTKHDLCSHLTAALEIIKLARKFVSVSSKIYKILDILDEDFRKGFCLTIHSPDKKAADF